MPDIAYLFAWNHKEEIFSKEKEFTKMVESGFLMLLYKTEL